MSRVLIIGSGPTGATYARLLIEQTSDVDVLMVEAGPVVSTPPGMNAKNIADPAEQYRARAASQGRGEHTAGAAALPGGTAAEGTITARFGTYLIGRPAEGSTGLPAAAVSANVGGQGVHWTCATPRPVASERIDFLDDLDELLDEASRLLHVTGSAFGDSPQAGAILERVGAEFAGDGVTVRPLPVAADPRADGTLRWSGTDVVLGPLAEGAHADRFELRPETLAVRLLREDDRVVGAVLRDQRTGAEEEVRADAVVVAANAFGTPQLLWNSGIRPEALGRYLTEHPLVFGIVAVREGVLPPPDRDSRLQTDPIRGVVSIAFGEGHPFHAQLMYSPVCPVPLPEGSPYRDNPAGYAMVGYGVRKFPRPEDRVTFDEGTPDENGLPGVVIAYDLTEREEAEIEAAKKFQARAAGVLGQFVEDQPRVMPPGTSLHFMGTFRMGPADDGTSVCDADSRVWGVPGLVLAGNGLIPTANSCNPTLTSVALAVRGARALATDLGATR
ncbi:GMC oxidoreductase [Petropleomorpha daqingensis]|uniref:Choline dehydrogenase-like flavoprotein n=1 Tax=Petropleomorpha daqingensis TaxID=2026353 RepID=A0A853CRF2_9ACTN|nr:GMC oxidoreductase [Petropleomorpha daqingensis]NYJ08493.1 choline dehydrogenase-like flavoprotein [Petropleomorpha daqingensis]